MNPSTNKFDFSYYCQENNINPDIVFINLGTNEVTNPINGHLPTLEETIQCWQEMVTSIKAYNSNIKIGMWLCPVACTLNGDGKTTRMKVSSAVYDTFKNTQNVYFLPAFVAVSNSDYPTEEIEISENETIVHCTDFVHFGLSGHKKIGTLMYGLLKYIGSLE